jgi:hypothetical protein
LEVGAFLDERSGNGGKKDKLENTLDTDSGEFDQTGEFLSVKWGILLD